MNIHFLVMSLGAIKINFFNSLAKSLYEILTIKSVG